jgi:hypothetical protein
MNKVIIVTFAFLWLSQQTTYAGNLCFVGEEVTCSSSLTSFQFVLGVDASNMDTPYGLTGWQLTAKIVRDQDAKGSVGFGTISEPPNYVFNGIDHEITPGDSTFDTLVASDNIFDPVLGGIDPVTVAPGSNLLVIDLISSDAVGRFNIEMMVTNPDTDSIWYSADFEPMLFDVKSITGQSAGVVGSIVFVPEPSSLVLFLSGAASLAFGWVRSMRKSRNGKVTTF